ncbi:MAG: autotransporter domain-containing protein, partial [Kluyvera intermedia]
MSDAQNSNALYLWDQTAGNTQSLTVNGTDMSGTYIQAGLIGTKNVTLNDATTDMIEGGKKDEGDATNINFVVNHSTLNGEDDASAYGYEGTAGNKSYMDGATIYIDSGANIGTNKIAIENNSTLNGAIYAETGGDNNISISGNSTVNGSIYTTSAAGNNSIAVTDSTIIGEAGDTTLLSKFEDSYAANDNAADINALLDGQTIAMAAYGTQSSSIALSNSTITGDIAMVGDGTTASSTASLSLNDNTTLTGDIILADHSAATVSLSDSTVTGDIDATNEGNTAIVMSNATVDGSITTGAGDDNLTLANNSEVTGNVDGGAGTNSLSLDSGSSIDGSINNFDTINMAGNNNVDVNTIDDGTTLNVDDNST